MLKIWSKTASEFGGVKVAPLIKNLLVAKSKTIARLSATSAGALPPGAPGFVRGTRLVSRSGWVEGVWVVVGSLFGAKT